MRETDELAAVARSVAISAGRLVLQTNRERPPRSELIDDATRKSSATDLATASDRASERFIVGQLRVLRPNDAILGEEGSDDSGTSGLTWLVDPIDGTTNFVYDFPAWTVSVAVADDEGAVAGAVYEPVRDECFLGTRRGGSALNGRLLGPLSPPALGEALVATGFSYSPERRVRQARLLPVVLKEVRDIRRAGSASLDCCYVAAGRVDAFVRDRAETVGQRGRRAHRARGGSRVANRRRNHWRRRDSRRRSRAATRRARRSPHRGGANRFTTMTAPDDRTEV